MRGELKVGDIYLSDFTIHETESVCVGFTLHACLMGLCDDACMCLNLSQDIH